MARIELTHVLRRHVDVPPTDVPGATVGEALAALFALHPRLGGYVLDEQGGIRKHVVIFADDARATLETALGPASEVFVMQALSGG
ncbi:MAG: MoaD/ThiS family protein [bacterium]